MRRSDWYIFGLVILQVAVLFHIISMMAGGSVVSVTGRQDVYGYLTVALLLATTVIPVRNLSKLLMELARASATPNEENVFASIVSVGKWTVAMLVSLLALEFVQSLALLSLYAGYY